MNPEQFRELFEYHFAANHRLPDTSIVPLTAEQFRPQLPHSLGSVWNQVVHTMNMEDRWLSTLNNQDYYLYLIRKM